MKRCISIVLTTLVTVGLARGQAVTRQAVTADASGQLVAPTNLWSVNAGAIRTALDIPGVYLNTWAGSTNITTVGTLTTGVVPWSLINNKPTTLGGYGITDAVPLAGGTLTGPLFLSAGSAGAPSLAFDGDTNTGIFSSQQDRIDFSLGGNARVSLSVGATQSNQRALVYAAIGATNNTGAAQIYGQWGNNTSGSTVASLYNEPSIQNLTANSTATVGLAGNRVRMMTTPNLVTARNVYGLAGFLDSPDFSAGLGAGGALTITNYYGMLLQDHKSLAPGVSIANQYGLYVEPPTRGTNNYAIHANGRSVIGGVELNNGVVISRNPDSNRIAGFSDYSFLLSRQGIGYEAYIEANNEFILQSTGGSAISIDQYGNVNIAGSLKLSSNPSLSESGSVVTRGTGDGRYVRLSGGTGTLDLSGYSLTLPGASAYYLSPFTGSATIPANQSGMGWDEDGRFTLQTPFGAFQVYQTGTPAVPTLYWPGKIISEKMESLASTTSLPASNIVGPSNIDGTIMRNSLSGPSQGWTGGIPDHFPDLPTFSKSGPGGTFSAFSLGWYYPIVEVIDGGEFSQNLPTGRFQTRAKFAEDLILAGTPPATPTSPGTRGQMVQHGNFLYICVATDTWRRIELLTW